LDFSFYGNFGSNKIKLHDILVAFVQKVIRKSNFTAVPIFAKKNTIFVYLKLKVLNSAAVAPIRFSSGTP